MKELLIKNKTDNQQTSTRHRDIVIQQKNELLQLVFAAEPEAIQSAINTQSPQQLVMTNLQFLMGILLFIPPPKTILLLGVGAGSLVHFFKHHMPQSQVTGVDFDEELIHIAQTQMMLPLADERLQYVIDDARQYIQQCTLKYDLVVVDIFDGSQSPEWTRDKQFTRQIKSCLSTQGAVAYNMLINSDATFKSFYSLLRQTFSNQTLCLETQEYENILLYALNFKTKNRSMMQNLQHAVDMQDKYQLPFNEILSVIYGINPLDSGIV